MKKILLIICLFPILVFSQKSYKIPADSTILNNIGSGKNELVIRNATSNITGGVLTNLGNGVTAFVLGGNSARVVDTIYKNNTKDSIVFTISGIRYAVKDSFNLNTDSQTLSISNDTLTISGGNSVILPVYIQIDSSTINSYDVLNSQNTPPVSPNTGDVYLVGNVPTGAWVGHAKDIAEWDGSAWVFTDGVQGDFLYNATNALTYIFRSGNWVQTTGIPALNNGNIISSGLKIGTNNARSLTFETNNANRGRFDSIGRFHVYNLPTATSADTFIWKANASGLATKVGQSTFLSGVNTALLPNGIKVVTESRDLQADDAGWILLLQTEDINIPTVLNIPYPSPLEVNKCFALVVNNSNYLTCGYASTPEGLTLVSPMLNENVLFTTTETDGGNYTFPVSTAAIDDKTALRYLYDNAISSNRKVDTSYIFRNATLDSTCMITVINGITYRSCAKDSVGSGTAYTFSTGLTNTSSTITNNLSTGVSGGQSVIGGTASGNSLTLSSTSNATKGKLLFGTSAYDEVNNRLGIGTTSPTAKLQVAGDIQFTSGTPTGGINTIFVSSGYLTIIPDGNGFLINNSTNSANLFHVNNSGAVKIGGVAPVASAKLEIVSTTQGFLPPRMTATQASAIASPAQGLMLFVTDTNGTFTSVGWWGYNGSAWEKLNN